VRLCGQRKRETDRQSEGESARKSESKSERESARERERGSENGTERACVCARARYAPAPEDRGVIDRKDADSILHSFPNVCVRCCILPFLQGKRYYVSADCVGCEAQDRIHVMLYCFI